MRNITAVFDLDGTLVDTAGDLARATNHALASQGLPAVPSEVLRPTVSYGARAMIEQGVRLAGTTLPAAEIDRMLEILLAHYGENIAVESRPFPAVVEVITRLRAQNARVAVCTNKREGLSRRLLRSLGIDELFHAVVGGDTLPVRKPDAGHLIGTVILADGDLGRTVMVGDSEVDVLAARAASIPVVGVSFGYTAKPIASFQPDAVIDHYDELEALLPKLLPRRPPTGDRPRRRQR